MKKRKTLQDLTIKDNFLFGAVMSVEDNCRGFLELVPVSYTHLYYMLILEDIYY